MQKDTSKPCGALEELVKEAEDIQRKLSESEDDEYRNDLALRLVHVAMEEKSTEVTPAIERYMKSINMDRVLVMEKFLIDYLSDADEEEKGVAELNASLVPFDLKVAQLKSVVPSGYHEFIESYWRDLKRSTTPGLMEACLPDNYNAEGLVKRYKLTIKQRETKCVPEGKNPFEVREYIAALIFCILFFCSFIPMFLIGGVKSED
uniref:Mono(ADP-ribosyl)transferase n=1 Tax=Steinernema glaseri TaxID=37863 RepID=A0A1I7YPI4_9BILA